MSKSQNDAVREYIFSQERVFGMRITFTSNEIWEWLDALECNFCTDSPDAIAQYEKIVKKLKNAEIRSSGSAGKICHIHFAEDRKQREHDSEVRESFAKALRESSSSR